MPTCARERFEVLWLHANGEKFSETVPAFFASRTPVGQGWIETGTDAIEVEPLEGRSKP